MRKILPGVLILMFLSACAAVGPDYTPPPSNVPADLTGEIRDAASENKVDPAFLAQWWAAFDDPVLSDLIQRAIAENPDMKQARARLNEARARRGVRQAYQFPNLDVSGNATRSGGSGNVRESYSAGFDAGWEIDVFGSVRRAVEAADADLQAGEADLNDVLVSLTAETALNYVDVRTLQARLETAAANLKAQTDTFDLVRFRFEAGLSDELAFQQARYQLESTRSKIPALRADLDAAKNRVSVLIGQPPGAVHDMLAQAKPVPAAPQVAATGIPAETLRRRPDVRKAERELAAQTARVGVATADLYPRFTLTGAIGLESADAGDLFTAGSRYWRVGPGVSWKVFDAGAIRRNIDIQSAIEKQYLIAYEKTVLNALEEVKNAMSTYAEDQLQQESLKEAVTAARRAEFLARNFYQAGMADFSDVLDAQRSLLSFENQLVENQGSVAADLIRLYKALGGGWQ